MFPARRSHRVCSEHMVRNQKGLRWFPGRRVNMWPGTPQLYIHVRLPILFTEQTQPAPLLKRPQHVKPEKYSGLPSSHLFMPIAFETLGPINSAVVGFIREVGQRLSSSPESRVRLPFSFNAFPSVFSTLTPSQFMARSLIWLRPRHDFSDSQQQLLAYFTLTSYYKLAM